MKKVLLMLFLSILKNYAFSQNEENPLPNIMQEPEYDIAPQFPGGSDALMKYFENSIRYPASDKTNYKQEYVSVKFHVTKEGKIINVMLTNGIPGEPNLAKVAVGVMEGMPDWIPAAKNGKPVEAEYNLSVPFKLKKNTLKENKQTE